MTLFSDQLHWFARLKRKQRFCVLYFCMSFGILLSIFFINPLLELLVVFFSGQLAIQSAFGHYIQQLFVSYTQYIIKVFHLPA